MRALTYIDLGLIGSAFVALVVLVSACSNDSAGSSGTTSAAGTSNDSAAGPGGSSGNAATAGAAPGGAAGSVAGEGNAGAPVVAPGQIPIVSAATTGDAPYQFGSNPFLIKGGAFFAKSKLGPGTAAVALDKLPTDKVCLKGTVDMVPTPADGSHPPYSDYWGIALGFNLNQGAEVTAVKTPWLVPANVIGFWFTVTGATVPPLRFKTTPTGKLPAQEQDSCALVTPVSGVPTQVLFKDMTVQCWNGTGPATDLSKGLEDISLQVAAATDFEYPLDFCVTAIGVITM